jgi:filamentous hemagglutinin family protein
MGALVLSAGGAGAETYRIVGGALEEAPSGASEALSGMLEISVFVPDGEDPRPSLLVDDFQLEAGARSFGPQQPVEFAGRAPIWVQIADQIQFDGDAVGLVHLRSGGELIAADENFVTFRFVDFRSDGSGENRLVGHLGDGPLPRRISLVGTLTEVDQHFLLPRGGCPVLPLPPGGGVVGGGSGGVISIGANSGGIIRFGRFDIEAGEGVVFQAPEGSGAVTARVTGGGASTIEGSLQATGALGLLNPSGVVFGATSIAVSGTRVIATAIPTLAELGISAPSGAEVAFDETGALTVTSQGDLVVAAGAIDLPGLTSLALVALGTITVEGTLELPPGVSLTLQSGELIVDGGIPAPADIVLEAPSAIELPFCSAIRAVFPAEEREIGHFKLVASAARQVGVVVEPRRRGEHIHFDHARLVSAAILGSADFDIRDVDEDSLRFGPGEAEPERRRGHSHRIDVDRDGEMDLVLRFDAREAGIASDDSEVCLFGEIRDGIAIEGCDAIEAQPRRRRGSAERSWADGELSSARRPRSPDSDSAAPSAPACASRGRSGTDAGSPWR